uniref:DUF1907 domain-containing protein n=1 Tax=Lotharella globosa TaxID=91324 RepID=A0A7S4DMT5_9EUKA|mmetsp:Transcript_576/g.870  ORF Transcript_576/g.870 Transcript_576/m.870 type:complete len:119 (-) Transcript_576:31-387(-)
MCTHIHVHTRTPFVFLTHIPTCTIARSRADTAGRVFTHSSQVQDYLKMFTMGPALTCATVMTTRQPAGAEKKVRLEHTHLFNSAGTEGGHYHGDVTPQDIDYVAYLVPCEALLLVDKC